ncbi:MAG: hypothetical protein ACFBQW_00775 [Sphingomonadaceae bacterium]
MKSISGIALGMALSLGGLSLVAASPAEAAAQKKDKEAAQGEAKIELSKEERAALSTVQGAITAQNWAAARAALPAAEAAAVGADAKFYVQTFRYQIGRGLQDRQMQMKAMDELIKNPKYPREDLPNLYKQRGAFANEAGDYETAEWAFEQYMGLQPNDHEMLVALAETKHALDKPQEAVDLLFRAIGMREQEAAQTGQPVPENWYKRALAMAYNNKMVPQSLALSQRLMRHYPTPTNLRDGLLIYRDLSQLPDPIYLDWARLMAAYDALAGERDYFDYAELANRRALYGEAKSVLDAGIAANMIDPDKQHFRELIANVSRRIAGDKAELAKLAAQAAGSADGTLAFNTAEAYLGYDDYAKAAELYRLAIQKGGIDVDAAQMRLGIALALMGDAAGAEAAFNAVAGQRDPLADYWLLYLDQQG